MKLEFSQVVLILAFAASATLLGWVCVIGFLVWMSGRPGAAHPEKPRTGKATPPVPAVKKLFPGLRPSDQPKP